MAYGNRAYKLLELRSFSIEPLNPGPLGPFMVLPTLSEMILISLLGRGRIPKMPLNNFFEKKLAGSQSAGLAIPSLDIDDSEGHQSASLIAPKVA